MNTKYIPNYPVVRYPFEYLKIKEQIPELNTRNKIIILSGSNSFYGFKAEQFEKYTGRTTINMAIQGSLGLNFMFYYTKPFLQRGDILILPLEYGVLLTNNNHNYLSSHVSYVYSGFDYFNTLPFKEKLSYLRSFKKDYFEESLKRRITGNDIYPSLYLERCVNSKGDMICNKSSEKIRENLHKLVVAQGFQDTLLTNQNNNESLPEYESLKILSDFLLWAKDNGIIVVGTYPNSIDTLIKNKSLVARINRWYIDHNQLFIGEPSESFFPENMMYDTVYHLNADAAELRTRRFSQRFCKETDFCKRA